MKKFRVRVGQKIRLKDRDAADTSFFSGDKAAAEEVLDRLTSRLAKLQNVFYAQGKHKLLVVLQGMDTSGKDGTIRHVFDDVNPQGVRVTSFKKPTEEELSKDYLWRVHRWVPGKGEIVLFNRSHYEDLLFPRVHGLITKEMCDRRYGHINDFERMLTDEGATIVKFFLHISKEEQKKRLKERLSDPDKRWKFKEKDLDERKLWKKYQEAQEEILSRTSTKYAPWHIIPADKKWYRNWAIAKTLVETLEGLHPRFPVVKIPRSVKL